MRRVGFATFVGAKSTFWRLVSRSRSEGDEFDEDLGRGFKSGTGSNELEEHFFFLLRQQLDIVVGAAVGSQNVDEGFGWDDWLSFIVQVGARVVCNKVVEVALDVGYREPIPAIYWHSCRKTEGWVFVTVVVVEGGRGVIPAGVLKVAGGLDRFVRSTHGFLKRPTKPKSHTDTMSDSVPQSDVSRPSALPTASLLQSRTSAAARLAQSQAQNSAQYLDDIEEEWNKKVDTEIETLVDGMVDIVSLASVSCSNTLNPTVREVERHERFEIKTSFGWHRRHSKLNVGQNRWYVNPLAD